MKEVCVAMQIINLMDIRISLSRTIPQRSNTREPKQTCQLEVQVSVKVRRARQVPVPRLQLQEKVL